MPNVPVQTAEEEKALPARWSDELQKFSSEIRRRAFDLFERHGRKEGQDIGHWLEAEKQLLTVPRSELRETGEAFEVKIAVPGFEASEIEVSALPDSLLVKAEARREGEKREGEIVYSEFSDQSLFRRFPLPQPIDTGRVAATLEKGVLRIAAQKAAAKKEEGEKSAAAGA